MLRLQPAERIGAAPSLCRYQRLRDLGEDVIRKSVARMDEAAIALAIPTLEPRNRHGIEPVDPDLLRRNSDTDITALPEALRTVERSVGKEGGETCRSWCAPYH